MLGKNEQPGERHVPIEESHVLIDESLASHTFRRRLSGNCDRSNGRRAAAQDTVKIGLVLPMTGTVGAAGQEVAAAVKLYMTQHGDTVAGKKIELIDQGRRQHP